VVYKGVFQSASLPSNKQFVSLCNGYLRPVSVRETKRMPLRQFPTFITSDNGLVLIGSLPIQLKHHLFRQVPYVACRRRPYVGL
jgi:hypothetical protein